MTQPNKQVTRPPAATGSGSIRNSQEITSMSVQESTGLAEWYAAVRRDQAANRRASRGRHAQRPIMDPTADPAPAPLPGPVPDPFGHVQVGDPDPDPSWGSGDKSLCNALSPTVIPVPSDDGESYTLRYACTRLPHPSHWLHIAADAVDGVIEVWHGDASLADTTVLYVADDLIDNEHQAAELVTEQWPALDGDDVAELSPADRVRQRDLTAEQREGLALVLDVYRALRDLGTGIDMPQPLDEALANAEAVLSPQAGA